MSPSEWVVATWADWCPTVMPGRFEVGPFVFMTRKAVSEVMWSGIELGRRWEADGFGPGDPTPTPRRLRSV